MMCKTVAISTQQGDCWLSSFDETAGMDDMRQLIEAMIIMSRPVFARAAEELSASPQLAVVWAQPKTGVIMHECLTAEMAVQRARWRGACLRIDCCGRCLMKSHPSDAAVQGPMAHHCMDHSRTWWKSVWFVELDTVRLVWAIGASVL